VRQGIAHSDSDADPSQFADLRHTFGSFRGLRSLPEVAARADGSRHASEVLVQSAWYRVRGTSFVVRCFMRHPCHRGRVEPRFRVRGRAHPVHHVALSHPNCLRGPWSTHNPTRNDANLRRRFTAQGAVDRRWSRSM